MPYSSNPNSMTGGPFGTTAATTNTGFFTDNTNPSSVNCNALPEPSSNVVAASGKWAGGRRSTKRRKTRRKKNTKRRRSRKHRRSGKKRILRRRRTKRGGTTNNVPNTPSYATGTALPYNLSALANPVPYWKLDNNTNCADNYNHFTGGKRRKKRKTRSKHSKKRVRHVLGNWYFPKKRSKKRKGRRGG
jgi:hypothetical protein